MGQCCLEMRTPSSAPALAPPARERNQQRSRKTTRAKCQEEVRDLRRCDRKTYPPDHGPQDSPGGGTQRLVCCDDASQAWTDSIVSFDEEPPRGMRQQEPIAEFPEESDFLGKGRPKGSRGNKAPASAPTSTTRRRGASAAHAIHAAIEVNRIDLSGLILPE